MDILTVSQIPVIRPANRDNVSTSDLSWPPVNDTISAGPNSSSVGSSGFAAQDGTSGRTLHTKQLQWLRGPWRANLLGLIFPVLIFGLSAGLITWLPQYSVALDDERESDCNIHPDTGVERSFVINIQVFDNLSFTKAKMIDLAWDLMVGHGGRLLHGWAFYRVAIRTITWMMEYAAVPYDFSCNIMFSSASFSSLWSSIRMLKRTQPVRCAVTLLLLILGMAHVLVFSAVWSAATGYSSPSPRAYIMRDYDIVTKDSDLLRLCWSISDKRLGLHSPTDGVVLGPTFGQHFKSFRMNEWTSTWDPHQMSEDFENIYACKFTRGEPYWLIVGAI